VLNQSSLSKRVVAKVYRAVLPLPKKLKAVLAERG
jgi:hypothetical protein